MSITLQHVKQRIEKIPPETRKAWTLSLGDTIYMDTILDQMPRLSCDQIDLVVVKTLFGVPIQLDPSLGHHGWKLR